ncbi:MAG: extracellular solute-binding protein [Chloroflexi bacterium]|nr:extracellular solute-binding protein [Chloroflexota bacterium]
MKRLQRVIIVVATLFPLLLGACGPTPAATETAPTAKPLTQAATPVTAWQEDWERTLAAARQEGKVAVFTQYPGEWRVAFAQEMSKRYGITLEAVVGVGTELSARVMREQANKVHYASVLYGGNRDFAKTYQPAGLLQSLEKVLILPEVTDPKVWWRGQLAWLDADTKTYLNYRESVSAHLLINTDLVKPEELKSWRDLLAPKWKTRILLDDPTVSGGGQGQMSMLAHSIMDWDYVQRLAEQQPAITRDRRMMVEWISRGRYPVGIGIQKTTATEFIDAGAPISFHIPSEGAYLGVGSGFITLLKTSPHPNAAKVFINFFLSKEGQALSSRLTGFQSSRTDVLADHILPVLRREPGRKYISELDIDPDVTDKTRDRVVEIFRPLVR